MTLAANLALKFFAEKRINQRMESSDLGIKGLSMLAKRLLFKRLLPYNATLHLYSVSSCTLPIVLTLSCYTLIFSVSRLENPRHKDKVQMVQAKV